MSEVVHAVADEPGAPIAVVGLDASAREPAADALSPSAREAVTAAEVVVGGRRHLSLLESLIPQDTERVVLDGDLGAALDAVVASTARTCVLASGDPGFFGVLRALRERLDASERGRGRLSVHPAVSSVAAVCAAAGVPWDDAVVVTAQGRDHSPAIATCRRHPKVVVLTEPGFGPAQIAKALTGVDRRLVVGTSLGAGGEVVELDLADAADRTWDDPNVVLVLDPAAATSPVGRAAPARGTPTRWALPESAFEHRAGMVTKAEVRALALAWLGPGVGDLVWDVGAGSGSVAIEASRLGAAAIAVEADAHACRAIERNAVRHGVPVEVVCGAAPHALADLPDPDAVFVGGAGEDLDVVVAVAAIRARRVVVVSLATVERVAPAWAALEAAGLEVEAVLVSASRLVPLAGGHRLAPVNPVVLVRGDRPPT